MQTLAIDIVITQTSDVYVCRKKRKLYITTTKRKKRTLKTAVKSIQSRYSPLVYVQTI